MKNNNFFDFNGERLNKILSQLMHENSVTLTKLSANTGIPIPTLKRLQSDPSANPTISSLVPVAKFFNLSVNQLIGASAITGRNNGFLHSDENWTQIPILSWGEVIEWKKYSQSSIRYVETDCGCSEQSFAVEVIEDDWSGFLKHSILILDTRVKIRHKCYALCIKDEKHVSFKQILKNEGAIYLRSPNPNFPMVNSNNEYQFIAVLVQVTFKAGPYSEDELSD